MVNSRNPLSPTMKFWIIDTPTYNPLTASSIAAVAFM